MVISEGLKKGQLWKSFFKKRSNVKVFFKKKRSYAKVKKKRSNVKVKKKSKINENEK